MSFAKLQACLQIWLFNLLCAILSSRSQSLIQDNLAIVDIGSHPMSPSKDEIGAFLPTTRKLLNKLFWIFLIFVSVVKPQIKLQFNDREY